jgi:hypothetical protein
MADLEIRTSQLGRHSRWVTSSSQMRDEYRDEWWWNWPGVVRECSELEDFCLIEFMGFAQSDEAQEAAQAPHQADTPGGSPCTH